MLADPTLLVVDDEEVICQGCHRVLSRQGYHVETSREAREGLTLASQKHYDAILLDISMPSMDGIEFLEHLRKRKPDVPVIFITGHPSIPNATSAVRLGAADYITKPFTPEEITESVQRLVRPKSAPVIEPPATMNEAVPWTPQAQGLRFWDETWMLPDEDGEVLVGPMVGRSVAAAVRSVRLPQMGEIVYQGLPMAALLMADGTLRTVPAPVSGVVAAVNSSLAGNPAPLAEPERRGGWIASIAPSRLEEEVRNCRHRRVLLLNADDASAARQAERLGALGCQVRRLTDWSDQAGADLAETAIVLDSDSFNGRGADIVERVNVLSPSTKVVVVAAPGPGREHDYRLRRIFYYAIQPFADGEIVDILDGVFRSQSYQVGKSDGGDHAGEFVNRICITSRSGRKVCLLAEGGLMQMDLGLGRQVRRRLLDRSLPVETTLGSSAVTPIRVMKAAGSYDRVIVLLARESGRLAGGLVQHKGEFAGITGPDAAKVTTLVVQPDKARGLRLDDRTCAMLAEHIVRQMDA
jgi:CheY-like chemotaxis protein/glycine cleavage system H lipoate-binding protein